jgi:hypothetical protein
MTLDLADDSPGVRSSTTGHHFGHPTNKFWVRFTTSWKRWLTTQEITPSVWYDLRSLQ